MSDNVHVHPTAEVAEDAQIGAGTRIWHQAQVREGAVIGRDCVLGKGVYVDHHVRLGDRVKIQNYVSIYHGVTLEDGVFVGPHACLITDRHPRALTPEGRVKRAGDWVGGKVWVGTGASIGAGAVILPDVTIGRHAMIGAGAVVTSDVPDYGLAVGNPARVVGYACLCGHRLERRHESASAPGEPALYRCPVCGRAYHLPELGTNHSDG
jgi:UDP-2-acetamido-3-amino-2,3-dideoxy-glucuronate N-acetyltransferase